jgi:hypothetical protein
LHRAFVAQVQSLNGLQSAPPAGHKRYIVTGSVANAITGEPIRCALVRLQGPEQHSGFTGADGRFEIQNVLEGRYMPTAQRPGFFDEQTRSGFMPGQGLTVTASSAPLLLKLFPECAIQGRVTDQEGEPIENLPIQLLQQQLVNGRRLLQQTQSASTDENGDFLVEGLQPGNYLVRSSLTPVTGLFADEAHAEVYPQQFYPAASDLSSAQTLTVRAGETARADFKLSPVPAFRVSGVAGPAPNGAMVSVEDATGEQITSYGGFAPKPGQWEVPFLPSGSWTISFRSSMGRPNNQSEYFAQLLVNVANAEIRNLQIALQPTSSIPVQILNGSEASQPNVQLRLIPRSTSQQEFYAGGEPNNPALAIRGALPGTYRVVAQSSGNGCIDSVSSGGTDFSQEDLVINSGSEPAPIDVTVRSDCAEITLQLRSSDPNARAFAVLVSDSNIFEPKTMSLQSGGSFAFGNLAPGDYRIYTLADISDLEYMNPEALRNLSAKEVTLAPNQKATILLDLPNQGSPNVQ